MICQLCKKVLTQVTASAQLWYEVQQMRHLDERHENVIENVKSLAFQPELYNLPSD